MSFSTYGIGALLLTTLAALDIEHSFGDDFLPLIGVVVLWFDFMSNSGGLEDEDEDEEALCRGPYALLKSADTLPMMLRHESLKWVRFFFRFVPIMNLCCAVNDCFL
jgi:hypothetical protein